MKTLTLKELNTALINQPLEISFDDSNDDAVISIHKNNKDSGKWFALPVEERMTSEQMNRLESYCASNKIKKLFAFSPCFLNTGGIISADTSVDNFQKIEGNFSLRAYTVIPEDKSFQIISDGDYYTIFIGTDSFLSDVLGTKLKDGMKQFKNYIEVYNNNVLVTRRLSKVLEACNIFNS